MGGREGRERKGREGIIRKWQEIAPVFQCALCGADWICECNASTRTSESSEWIVRLAGAFIAPGCIIDEAQRCAGRGGQPGRVWRGRLTMNSLCRQSGAHNTCCCCGLTDCPAAATLPSDADSSSSNRYGSNIAAAACKLLCCCTCNSFEPRTAE